jgi:hypothetical protein
MLAMTVMGEKKEASAVLSENGGVPAEELDAWSYWRRARIFTSLSGTI